MPQCIGFGHLAVPAQVTLEVVITLDIGKVSLIVVISYPLKDSFRLCPDIHAPHYLTGLSREGFTHGIGIGTELLRIKAMFVGDVSLFISKKKCLT